jgi:hypothetical protein
MGNSIPEANFIQLSDAMKRVIGDYISKAFCMVEKQENILSLDTERNTTQSR